MNTPQALLSAEERRVLKARAHALDPVVRIGAQGLSAAVLTEIERALAAHALIKVHAATLARSEREATLAAICEHCAAQPVQHVGKVLVVYRKKPQSPRAALSAPASRSAGSARGHREKRPASRRHS